MIFSKYRDIFKNSMTFLTHNIINENIKLFLLCIYIYNVFLHLECIDMKNLRTVRPMSTN